MQMYSLHPPHAPAPHVSTHILCAGHLRTECCHSLAVAGWIFILLAVTGARGKLIQLVPRCSTFRLFASLHGAGQPHFGVLQQTSAHSINSQADAQAQGAKEFLGLS
jgi:hypothetical protein